jgi:hypothetical protein
MFAEFVKWVTENPVDRAKGMTDKQLSEAVRDHGTFCSVYRDEMNIRLLERSKRGWFTSSEVVK